MEISVERLERARSLMAYNVLRHGVKFVPILDRLDREVEEARKNDPIAKAKRIVEEYIEAGARCRSSGR